MNTKEIKVLWEHKEGKKLILRWGELRKVSMKN